MKRSKSKNSPRQGRSSAHTKSIETQLFGTDGIRGKANYEPLDTVTLLKIGKGLAEYVKDTVTPNPNRTFKVLIGKDTRRSGYMIEQALTAGFLSRGVDVMLTGPLPTPAISHLVRSFALDMGVMISASHNPYFDNGVKVFNHNGVKPTDEEEVAIEKYIIQNSYEPIDTIGRAKRIDDAAGRYVEFIKSIVGNVPLSGVKVVLDCANGAAYSIAPTVFAELGAQVVPIHIAPDGYNINDSCGSQHTEVLQKKVLEEHADIGVALDGDADRVILVDEKGRVVDGDYIAAIVATYLKEEKELRRNTIVMTEYSNLALDGYLKDNGIKILKVINGDREVARVCREKGLVFGGEQSGHFIFFDFTETGDGTLTALFVMKIMKERKKKLSSIASLFEKYPQEILNIEVREKIPLEDMPDFVKLREKWGRKLAGKGRIFPRYSGTQNMLRIMIEAEDKPLLKEACEEIQKLVPGMLN